MEENRKYDLVVSPEADDDLLSIWRRGADEWSPEQADWHLYEIAEACERLLDDPLLGRARDELIPGIRSISVRPHVVFYWVSHKDSAIEIVRVLHQREDIENIFR